MRPHLIPDYVPEDEPIEPDVLRNELAEMLANSPLSEGSVANTLGALMVGHLDRIATALEQLAWPKETDQ